jgi:hypothetical protein
LYPFSIWRRVDKRSPVRGPHTTDVHLGARPEHGRRDVALTLCGDPQRLAAPPAAVSRRRRRHRESLSNRCVEHVVGDNAVMLGIEPGHDRVVAGEGLGGELGNESLRPDARRGQCIKARRDRPVEVVPSPSIEGDEDQDWPLGLSCVLNRLRRCRLTGAGADRCYRQDQREDPAPVATGSGLQGTCSRGVRLHKIGAVGLTLRMSGGPRAPTLPQTRGAFAAACRRQIPRSRALRARCRP